MGAGFCWQCPDCNYEFSASLGMDFFYPKLYAETIEAAKRGEFGDYSYSINSLTGLEILIAILLVTLLLASLWFSLSVFELSVSAKKLSHTLSVYFVNCSFLS